MKKLYVLFLLFVFAQFSVVAEERKLNPGAFESVRVSGAYYVTLSQNATGVTMNGNEGDLDKVHVEVEDGVLTVRPKSNKFGFSVFKNMGRVDVVIGVRQLKELEVSGACTLSNDGVLNLRELDLEASGASKVKLNLETSALELGCSGASKLRLSGKTGELEFDVSGASNVNALDLKAGSVKGDASGASNLKVFVMREINIELSGASSVRYGGKPTKVEVDASGASSAKPI